jgi:hypothetical protein
MPVEGIGGVGSAAMAIAAGERRRGVTRVAYCESDGARREVRGGLRFDMMRSGRDWERGARLD